MMKGYNFKRLAAIVLIFIMEFVNVTYVEAKQKDDRKEGKNDKNCSLELTITNIPDNLTLTKNTQYDFDASIDMKKGGKGKADKGIIRFELSNDYAGVGYVSEEGIVQPIQAGNFQIRALYFQNDAKYRVWLKNKNKNETMILMKSKWYEITVEEELITDPELTLIGDPVIFVQQGSTYVDPGVRAFDKIDGDITDQVEIYGGNVSTDCVGEFYTFYQVDNSNGYYTTLQRMVVVTDLMTSVAPVIMTDRQTLECNINDSFEGLDVIAWDYEDGDITNQIVYGGDVVDPTKQGRYDVTFDVTDNDGNAAVQKSLIVVFYDPLSSIDYIEPYILVLGNEVVNMNTGETYVEEGVYSWDNFDGDISSKVVINSNLNVNVPGTYQITYDVSDAAGNLAKQAVRTIIISDREDPAPKLVLNGDLIEFYTVGEPYIEKGATAVDNVDGDLTSQIIYDADYNINKAFSYYILSYSVTDSSGNSAQAQRYVVYSEIGASVEPVIMLKGDYLEIYKLGTEYKEAGAIAFDDLDGDISSKIVIDSSSVNNNVEGIYYVTYNVMDNNDLYAQQVKRKVVFMDINNPLDINSPVINLNGESEYYLNGGDNFIDPGFTVWDDVDADLESKVIVNGFVDTSKPGTYIITYDVSDAAGNLANQKVRTIIVSIDITSPVINLYGDSVFYLNVGDSFLDPGFTVWDDEDADLESKVVVNGFVDTTKPGTYQMTYDVSDAAGNLAEQAVRTIIVSDWMAPELALNGDPIEFYTVGEPYIEKGVTAVDNVDGDLTNQIVYDAEYNINKAFSYYIINYSVTDSSGNSSQAQRFIVYSEPGSSVEPVIMLKGEYCEVYQLGTEYKEVGAIAFDDLEGDISSKIVIDSSSVNNNVEGIYYVTYNVIDNNGLCANQVERKVVFMDISNPIEITSPIIHLNGESVYYLKVGDSFTDLGYTVWDDVDVDLESKVIVNGFVDTSKSGIYIITYDVSDVTGNVATQATRTIIVFEY